MNRAFVHLELNTDDIERAREFYREVFGWTIEEVPLAGQTYTQIATPRPPAGGIQPKPRPEMPSHWMPYVGVASVRDVVERARQAGASIVADYSATPGHGAVAIITDPSGATFGVWQVEAEPEVIVEADEHGVELVVEAEGAPVEPEVEEGPTAAFEEPVVVDAEWVVAEDPAHPSADAGVEEDHPALGRKRARPAAQARRKTGAVPRHLRTREHARHDVRPTVGRTKKRGSRAPASASEDVPPRETDGSEAVREESGEAPPPATERGSARDEGSPHETVGRRREKSVKAVRSEKAVRRSAPIDPAQLSFEDEARDHPPMRTKKNAPKKASKAKTSSSRRSPATPADPGENAASGRGRKKPPARDAAARGAKKTGKKAPPRAPTSTESEATAIQRDDAPRSRKGKKAGKAARGAKKTVARGAASRSASAGDDTAPTPKTPAVELEPPTASAKKRASSKPPAKKRASSKKVDPAADAAPSDAKGSKSRPGANKPREGSGEWHTTKKRAKKARGSKKAAKRDLD